MAPWLQVGWNIEASVAPGFAGARALVQDLVGWAAFIASWTSAVVADDLTAGIRLAVYADELIVWLLRRLASIESFND